MISEKKPSNEEKSWTAWNTGNSLPTNGGYYYLTTNVTLSSSWSPADGTVLCLNGHNIKNTGGPCIKIYSNRTITLTDCKSTGKLYLDGVTGTIVYIHSNSTFNMYGGNLSDSEGEIVVCMGTFNMYGGSISNNVGDQKKNSR